MHGELLMLSFDLSEITISREAIAAMNFGQGAVLRHSAQVTEDRGADPHHRTEGVDFAGRWLPPCRALEKLSAVPLKH